MENFLAYPSMSAQCHQLPSSNLDFSMWAASCWRALTLAMVCNIIEQGFLENLPNVRESFDPRKGEEEELECILEAVIDLEPVNQRDIRYGARDVGEVGGINDVNVCMASASQGDASGVGVKAVRCVELLQQHLTQVDRFKLTFSMDDLKTKVCQDGMFRLSKRPKRIITAAGINHQPIGLNLSSGLFLIIDIINYHYLIAMDIGVAILQNANAVGRNYVG
ncbi:hypothetical protein ACLOJK_023619 [Asimina triloba]